MHTGAGHVIILGKNVLEVTGLITCVCMNPSFDKTVEVDALLPGKVNRIRSVRQDVGGKGINVAIVARRLGLEARCVGCVGKDGAKTVLAALEREGIEHAFLPVEGAVRTNLKVVSRDNGNVTEFNEPGAEIFGAEKRAFFGLVREKAADSEYVVITGSLPPGCPPETYRDMIREVGNTPCLLDVGGEALNLGVEAKPFLIKPNLHELEESVGTELRTLRAIRDAADVYLRQGVQHVVVSLGSLGAMYVGKETSVFAPAIKVPVRSTVGAGDAMIGGLLKGLRQEKNMAKAFRYGVAAGTASVMTEGTQLIQPEDFERLLDQVRVQEV